MTVDQFKGFIISLFGPEHHAQEKTFYMKVYVAAYKNNELGELYEVIDDIKYMFQNPKILVRNPASFFNDFLI